MIIKRALRKTLSHYLWGMSSRDMATRVESWSQFGEDRLIDCLVRKETGFYVDVGAYDACYLSNTYLLYRKGWHGVVIDANPDVEQSFVSCRPKDLFINSAVGTTPGMVTLKRFECGAFNCVESQLEGVPDAFRKETSSVEVNSNKLSALLEQANVETIDVLSVDCEGFDLEVLQSNNWDKWSPKVVCVEDHGSDWKNSSITLLMDALGYELVYRTGPSSIFQKRQHAAHYTG